jgi:hypothetical protein
MLVRKGQRRKGTEDAEKIKKNPEFRIQESE